MKRNNKTAIFIITVLSIISFYRCEDDPYDQKTYFNVIGKGYIFYYADSTEKLIPMPGSKVTVSAILAGHGFLPYTAPSVKEEYTSDADGCFQVRFIKHTQKKDAIGYSISVSPNYPPECNWTEMIILGNGISLSVEDIQKANKMIDLDTVTVRRPRPYPPH
jgi:hypothetical protein